VIRCDKAPHPASLCYQSKEEIVTLIELSPTEATELSPAELNTKLTKRGRGRLRKLTAVPPTALP
jgi:hypothetical protein